MTSKIITFPLLTVCFTTLALSQAGQSGLSFLKLGVGARSLGMGEAAVASANDPSAAYYNPAALRFVGTPQVLFMHKEWIQGTQTEFLAASVPLASFTFGASLNSTSIPDIEIRQRPGPPEDTFAARNVAIGASAAYDVDTSLHIGVSIKYLYEKILVDEASGIGIDLGSLYKTPWDFTVGISVANVGFMGKLRNEASKLPTTLRVGAARYEPLESIDGTLTLAADVVSILPDKKTHIHLGTEFAYMETFSVRAGYISGFETRNFTAGAGLRYGFITVDYAFVPFRLDFGTTHTFSLMINF